MGETIPDFTLRDINTGELVTREKFAGGILVFDFFAYWCGPCALSTPVVTEQIEEYYAQRGGNPAGIPVYLISIDTDEDNPSQTREFIKKLGSGLAFVDVGAQNLEAIMPNSGGIPYFAVVNGIVNDAAHNQWELLAYDRGFGGADELANALRPAIDAIAGPPNSTKPEPIIFKEPINQTRNSGEEARFNVGATGKQPFNIQWYKDGKPLPGATQTILSIASVSAADAGLYQAEIKNEVGTAISKPASLIVPQSFRDWIRPSKLTGNDIAFEADPDHDGQSNLAEFLQSTDPANPADRYVPSLKITGDAAKPMATVQFRVNPGAQNVAYEIESSRDLKSWSVIDRSSDQVVETNLGSSLLLAVTTPVDSGKSSFYRLRVIDPLAATRIQVGQTIQGALTTSDQIDPYYLENFDERYYLDRYSLDGLIDGKEYRVTLEYTPLPNAPENDSLEPWLDLINPVDRSVLGSVNWNWDPTTGEAEGTANFTFIADGSREYLFSATSYNFEETGAYRISVNETSSIIDLPLGQPVKETLDPTFDIIRETGSPEDTYHLKNLPAGKEVSVIVQTDPDSAIFHPEVEFLSAATRQNYFTASNTNLVGNGPAIETRFTFVPEAGADYLIAAHDFEGVDFLEPMAGPFHYTIKVDESDFIAAIRPGDARSGTVSTKIKWTFDDKNYSIAFYELTDAKINTRLDIDMASTDADDVRIFVIDAATWELVFKDVPTEVGLSKSTFFLPQPGKTYFIGAGVPYRDADTTYTMKIRQD